MAIWIIPAIIIVAVLVGVIFGTAVGKSRLKRSKPGYKPLFSVKEKLIYTALVLGGTALILAGVFVKFPTAPADPSENGVVRFEEAPAEVPIAKSAM